MIAHLHETSVDLPSFEELTTNFASEPFLSNCYGKAVMSISFR